MIAMVDGWGRTAACRAADATDVLALDRTTWLRLFESNERVGSVIRMAVIRAFCEQLTSLDAKFAAAKHENQVEEERSAELPGATGDSDAAGGSDAGQDEYNDLLSDRPVFSEPSIRLFNLVAEKAASGVGFEIRDPDGEERTVYMDRRVIKIGTAAPADLLLLDNSVSALHAVIDTASEHCVIIDLGSERGTLVHGQRIDRADLRVGDRVTIGDTVIAFLGRQP